MNERVSGASSSRRAVWAKAAVWGGFAAAAWTLPAVFLDARQVALPGILLLIGGFELIFAARDGGGESAAARWSRRGAGAVFIGIAALINLPKAAEVDPSWETFSEDALANAASAGQPALIDFYASWCAPCRRLEREVFSSRMIADFLAETGIRAIKADVTDSRSPAASRLMSRYAVEALPTVVFIGGDGVERRELRLVGWASRENFADRLRALAKR